MKFLLFLFLIVSCNTKTIPDKKPVVENVFTGSFYKVESTLDWIKEAVRITNCVTIQKDFHAEILAVEKFEHYSGSNQAIVDSLLSDKVAVIGTYSKRFTKARAYRNVGTNKIWLNRAKIFKADKDLINTNIHERLHVLGYGHKGNNRNKYNNINSVPYKVGSMSEKYYERCL